MHQYQILEAELLFKILNLFGTNKAKETVAKVKDAMGETK